LEQLSDSLVVLGHQRFDPEGPASAVVEERPERAGVRCGSQQVLEFD